MPQYYLLIGILLLCTNLHAQQCVVNPSVDIPDNGKSYHISLEVNTTQSGSRLLCGVRLSFTHQFADELRFVLVSPAGKQITLIAGKSASSKTNGSTWNVLFVRPDDSAHPDDFKKPLWNENKWTEDQDYIGSYYPDDAQGLSYFDGEKSIGTWNLIYSDQVNGGKGKLKSFSLIFCDPPVHCSPCAVSIDFVQNQDLGSFCGGDEALKSVRPAVISSGLTPGFDAMYMVLNGKKQIVSRGTHPDLSLLNAGSYEIIGVQYRPDNRSLVNQAKTAKELNNLFYSTNSNICGAVSKSSNKLTILSNPGVQEELLEIYGRDYVFINGKRITADQTIMQSLTDQNGCDSLVNINVVFKEYTQNFTQDHLYNCEHTTINVTVKTKPDFPVHRWFTKDGRISNKSDINSNQIIVDAPGTYFVVFEISDYLDTVAYDLSTDPNSPVITLANEYTLCSASPLRLTIGSNFDEATVMPSSNASIEGTTLVIREPDLYTVTVMKGTCELTKYLLVQPPEDSESIPISDAELVCSASPVAITPTLPREYEHYSWSYEGAIVAASKTLHADEPGLYAFRAYDGDECGVSGTVWIKDGRSAANLTITGPSLINCSNADKDNQLVANFQGDFQVLWTLPDGSTSTDKKIPVQQEGTYRAETTDNSGCTFKAIHTVETSQDKIDFEVPDEVIIPCDSKTVPITANVMASADEYDITWEGASISDTKTTAIAGMPGSVTATVTHKVSQCSSVKTISVKNEAGKPELIIDPSLELAITCDVPERSIPVKFNNCDDCEPDFPAVKGIIFQDNKFLASQPGTIVISLDNGTCISSQSITFPDRKDAKKPKIEKENIGCSGQSGRIEITNSKDYSSITYQTSQTSATSYVSPLTNIEHPDTYTFIYTDKSNGCKSERKVEIESITEPPKVEYEPVQYLECSTGKVLLTVEGPGINLVKWVDEKGIEIGHESKTYEVHEHGIYRFVAYGEGSCYQEGTIVVEDDQSTPSIDLAAEYMISCNSANISITPDYDTTNLKNVIWYGPGGWSSIEFFPTLTTGEYRVLLIGKNGCTTTQKTSVTLEKVGTVPDLVAPPITCQNPFSRVHLRNYRDIEEIQWIDESGQAGLSDSFDVYNPGKIILTIQKKNGCLFSKSITIMEDKDVVPFKINKPVIDCHDLHPQFMAEVIEPGNRPVYYQWYFENIPVGTDATHDIKYPGDYRVEVSYDNGCVDSLSHTVNIDTSAVDFQLQPDTISCIRSKIQLRNEINTKQISIASWSGPSGFTSTALRPNFQTPGVYQVSYAGKNGCEGRTEMEIYGDVHPPKVDSVDYLSLGCGDKQVDLTYHTNDSVVTQYWQLPDGQILKDSIIKINAKGDYTLYLEGINGCSKIDTFIIDQTISPKFDLKVDDVGCDDHGGNALLLAEKDTFQAIWYDPDGSTELGRGHLSPDLEAGSYLVTVINPYNDCDSTTAFEIRDISKILDAQIAIDDSLRCERNQANLISSVYPPSENYRYEWKYQNNPTPISEDSIVVGISKQGLYSLTVTDTINKCTVQYKYQNVRAPSRLQYFDLFLTEPACDINRHGFAIMDSLIGASDMSLVTYSLNGSPYIGQDTFPFLYANETYMISARDQYGCQLDTTIIPELRGIMDRVSLIADTTINSGDSIDFNNPAFKISYTSTDAPLSEQYTWILNPDTLSCDYDCTEMIQKQFFHTRTISAQLTNQYGCSITDTFQIYVREGDVLNIPNAIAPGSSRPENANVCIYTNEYISEIELFVVFNRLGNVIFKRTNFDPRAPDQELDNCWNGRDSQNNIHPPGSYNYYVRYKTVYGASKQKYGNIFLLR